MMARGPLRRSSSQSQHASRIVVAVAIGVALGCVLYPHGLFGFYPDYFSQNRRLIKSSHQPFEIDAGTKAGAPAPSSYLKHEFDQRRKKNEYRV